MLDHIYSALNDGQPQQAATALSSDIIKSEHDLDYLCQPFTHRAHYVVSIVEEADGTYLARVRTLFKPFKERAYVFHFRKSTDSFFAYRIQDDPFTQESEAAKDTVRQFISAAKSQDWERVPGELLIPPDFFGINSLRRLGDLGSSSVTLLHERIALCAGSS